MRFTPPGEVVSGSIEEILPRKNQFARPLIANIDLLLIVLSAEKPPADLLLVDKLLLYGLKSRVPVAIGINKTDAAKSAALAGEYAGSGAQVVAFSAKDGTGLDTVRRLLQGKFTCLAGQSAVGKSTLLNALCPSLSLETGELSKKTARGRHTTRYSELLPLREIDAVVADTPGFSMLECMDLEPEELKTYYREFHGAACRFDTCLHDKEPGCVVKERVVSGQIPAGRYERYIRILHELEERRNKRYD